MKDLDDIATIEPINEVWNLNFEVTNIKNLFFISDGDNR